MEAYSFGIPSIATDVGGTGEIVQNGETGYLLDADITVDELAGKIEFLRFCRMLKNCCCEKCRSLWEMEFCAEHNFTKFAQQLKA